MKDVSHSQMPDYDTVMARLKKQEASYTYEELCEKRLRVGQNRLNDAQYWNWKQYDYQMEKLKKQEATAARNEQYEKMKREVIWSGMEDEEKDYWGLLTPVEFYFICRKYLPECKCFDCAKCPTDAPGSRYWGLKNHCFEGMSEEEKRKVVTVKSLIYRDELIASCPLYEKANDEPLFSEYLKSPVWKEMEAEFLEEHPFCEGCGRGAEEVNLLVHHKSHDHLCFEREFFDWSVLCEECHKELHENPQKFLEDHGTIIPVPGVTIEPRLIDAELEEI